MRSIVALALVCAAGAPSVAQPQSWTPVGPGGGGALFAPAYNPVGAEINLACDMSEQFRSFDGGVTWAATPFQRLQAGRDTPRVQFTSDPLIRYTIDSTNEVRTPVRSGDAGATWAPLPGDPTGAEAWGLWADPARTDRVLLTDYRTLHISQNSGATFSPRYTGADASNGLRIAGAFFDGAFIALGTNDGLLISSDSGASFALVNGTGLPATDSIVGFAGARTGTTTRFVCVTLNAGSVYAGIQGDDHGGYRSVYVMDWTGPGSVWVQRTSGIAAGDHPFFAAMARSDAGTAWLAGGSNAGVPVVYRSTNAGQSWQKVLLTAGNQNVTTGWQGSGGDRDWGYDELVFGFDVHPTDPARAIFTGYGFAHRTTDGGQSWLQCYVDPMTQNPPGASTPKGRAYRSVGLENTTVWHVGWADAATMWASYADIRGTRSTDGGATWGFGYSGHTLNASYWSVVHPTTGVMYLATSSVHDLYQSTYLADAQIDGGTGNVLFSTNKGATWQGLGAIGHPVVALSLDPTNPARLYAGVVSSTLGGIYVCSNISAGTGATWTKLPAPPRTQGHAFNIRVLNDGSLVCSYSGRRAGSPLNFTASSGVFHSTDGGQTWADLSDPGMLYWTKDVVIDPADPAQNRWFACVFSGWGGAANDKGGLYRTTDRGLHWARVWNNTRVESITFDPSRPGRAYLTTERDGLWLTPDAGAPAPVFNPVASYPFRQPNRVFFNPFAPSQVWVTSFGHGLRVGNECYPNCDSSTATPALNVADFTCFLQKYAAGDAYANCDASTAAPTLNVADLTCFLQQYAAGCP